MKHLRCILGLMLALAATPAVAQSSQGSSPLSIPKGGTSANTAAGARTALGLAIGTNVQAWDADLDCLAANSTAGMLARTGAGTCAARTITAPAAGFTITNPAGTAGNPTFVLANDLAALEALASTGFASRTGSDAWSQRTFQAPAAGFTITNPAGVAGDPTFVLANDLAALEGLSSTGIARRTGTDAWSVGTLVTNAELANVSTATFKGRTTGGSGSPEDLTATQATALLNNCVGDSGSGGTKGLVTAPGAGDAAAGKFLKADCSWSVPAGGGGGGGVDDTTRQNILLTSIYQSKSFSEYRRMVNLFATGFKGASDSLNGIVTGSSSNYTVDASGGKVSPTFTVAPRITGATPTSPLGGTAANINDNNTGTTATTTAIGDKTGVSVNSRIFAKLDLGSSRTVTSIELKNAVLSAGSDPAAGLYYSTDDVTYTQLGADYTVSTGTGSTTVTRTGPVTARYVAATVGAIAFGTITLTVADLNAYGSDVYNNMTLVTTSQTSDASVSNGRVLLEYDNTASPTLNTDLTAEVTCNGGSNWASATLSSVTANSQGGRKVAETADTACTSGTSSAARLKTLNNKNVPVYGVSLSVH